MPSPISPSNPNRNNIIRDSENEKDQKELYLKREAEKLEALKRETGAKSDEDLKRISKEKINTQFDRKIDRIAVDNATILTESNSAAIDSLRESLSNLPSATAPLSSHKVEKHQ